MSKNEGLQIWPRLEHKTERFRAIEVIVNFWEPVEVGKNGVI
jgi:hypothetical protein